MMDIFISIGFDTAIKKYVLFTEKNHHDLATDYLVYVMMMLTFIYSKADIMNPYLARYKNGASNLLHNLTKYGLGEEKVNKFFSGSFFVFFEQSDKTFTASFWMELEFYFACGKYY